MKTLNVLTGLVVVLLASACGSKNCSEIQTEITNANQALIKAMTSGGDVKAAQNRIKQVREEYDGDTCKNERGEEVQINLRQIETQVPLFPQN